MKQKILYYDTETTGLTEQHAVIQMAGILEVDGVEVDRFNIMSAPFDSDLISPQALAVNNRTEEEIRLFPSPTSAKLSLQRYLDRQVNKYDKKDKLYMVGFNVGFDHMMTRSFFQKNGDNYIQSYFHAPVISVDQLLADRMMGERHLLPNTKLGTLAKYLGVITEEETADLHDALKDVEVTRALYKLITRSREPMTFKEMIQRGPLS